MLKRASHSTEALAMTYTRVSWCRKPKPVLLKFHIFMESTFCDINLVELQLNSLKLWNLFHTTSTEYTNLIQACYQDNRNGGSQPWLHIGITSESLKHTYSWVPTPRVRDFIGLGFSQGIIVFFSKAPWWFMVEQHWPKSMTCWLINSHAVDFWRR